MGKGMSDKEFAEFEARELEFQKQREYDLTCKKLEKRIEDYEESSKNCKLYKKYAKKFGTVTIAGASYFGFRGLLSPLGGPEIDWTGNNFSTYDWIGFYLTFFGYVGWGSFKMFEWDESSRKKDYERDISKLEKLKEGSDKNG